MIEDVFTQSTTESSMFHATSRPRDATDAGHVTLIQHFTGRLGLESNSARNSHEYPGRSS